MEGWSELSGHAGSMPVKEQWKAPEVDVSCVQRLQVEGNHRSYYRRPCMVLYTMLGRLGLT